MNPKTNHLLPPAIVGLILSVLTCVAGALELRDTDDVIEVWAAPGKLILRYHKKESAVPEGVSEVYRRSGYIHPVMTPDGREVTGDFAVDHPHQHGLFCAWTRGNYAGKKIDFWNQKKEEGRVAHKRVLATHSGEKYVSFTVQLSHFDQREGGGEILHEIWTVKVHEVTGDHFIFDIESRQSLVGDQAFKLEKYHYGGMALRGNGDWLGKDGCRFLTNLGGSRVAANHTAPDWVAMSGELDGRPATVAVMGHPKNFRAPQRVRIHPEKPYFCFAPMVDGEFSIKRGEDYVSRYRYLVSGDAPDKKWIESQWKEYAKPE
jgi:hypothetical protein